MSVKVTITKELTLDLNAYWEHLPKRLREEVLDHITKLLSTDGSGIKRAAGRSWRAEGDGFALTYTGRKWRVGKSPAKGRQRAIWASLHDKFGEDNFTTEDIRSLMTSEGISEKDQTSMIGNLWSKQALFANRVN